MFGIITEVYGPQQRQARKTENNTRGELGLQRSDGCNGGDKDKSKARKRKRKRKKNQYSKADVKANHENSLSICLIRSRSSKVIEIEKSGLRCHRTRMMRLFFWKGWDKIMRYSVGKWRGNTKAAGVQIKHGRTKRSDRTNENTICWLGHFIEKHGAQKRRALCDIVGLGPERRVSLSGKERGSKQARTARSGSVAPVSVCSMALFHAGSERMVDDAVGRRAGLLARAQERLYYIECRGRHRAAELPQAAVVVLGLLWVICTVNRRSQVYVCRCRCMWAGVRCRIERGLRKPVLGKLNSIP